ncbi:MAG TPA: three-Cys-motif partner protein TcmP [bacterium]|nr:three-Cys-motif partner protein TcmP [bacterium]HPS31795.1 three-Cys-motif partner protein TcmP [bacterium]
MPVKDLFEEPFTIETVTKLEVFESYLEAWLPVFIYAPNFKEINICDFFAGSGKDKLDVAGSPLRIIKIIKEFENDIFKKQLKINVILNEYDKDKFSNMIECFEEKRKDIAKIRDLINVVYHNDDFQKLFEETKDDLRNMPNLIFLDQNGIKHVKKEILLEFESFKTTDFLFFFSSSYLLRFRKQYQPLFPELNFDELAEGKSKDVHRKVLEYYRNLLPNESRTNLYPFTIKKGRGFYGLIFGSKHPLGVSKFLDVAWTKNNSNGEANFDIDEDAAAKQTVLFGEQKLTKIEKFQQDLRELINQKGAITNEEIYNFTLENGHIVKHAIDLLIEMRDNKEVEYFKYPKIGYDRIFKEKDVVQFKVIKNVTH